MQKKKKGRAKRINTERQLQAVTVEMAEAWGRGEWGKASSQNFAAFCRWLLKQIARQRKT